MDVNKAIEKRYSSRTFRSEKRVRLKDIYTIMDSVVYTPMAGGMNTIRLILIKDAETIVKIANAAPENEFLGSAPYLIVVCSDLKQAEKLYGYKGVEQYGKYQAGAAIQNMLLTTTSLKLNSCWIGSFDKTAIKRILTIPTGINIDAILPIGYELKKPARKTTRPNLKNMLSYNQYGQKKF